MRETTRFAGRRHERRGRQAGNVLRIMAQVSDTPSDESIDALLRRGPAAAGGQSAGEPTEADGCDDGLVIAWMAGAVDATTSERVESHLAECAFCRDLVRAARRSRPTDAAWKRAEASVPRRSLRWVLPSALAAAAAVVLVVLASRPAGPPEYALEGPFGGVQEGRSEPGVSMVFLPYSVVRLEMTPVVAGAPHPLAVYAARPGEPLRAASPDVAAAGPGGAWRVQFRADTLLGPEPGRWVLHLVAGEGAHGLEGRPAPDTPPSSLRWLRVEVEYRPEAKE